MDLIYTNEKREDEGVLLDYFFDLAFGEDENNFELKVDRNHHCCNAGYLVYIEGTEYGGIIDTIRVNTEREEVMYEGRTWQGILENKILCPDVGEDYLVVAGEANVVLEELIQRLDLKDMFTVSKEASGFDISYQFPRYIDGYSGIRKMLKSSKCKLKSTFKEGIVELSAVPLIDYSKNEQFDSDLVALDIEKKYNPINHIICLGGGDLKDRQVIHLYADTEGNISHTQTITGINERVATYDYPNAESLEELEKGGIEKLQEAYAEGNVSMDFDAEDTVYDIDDIVGSKDIITGVEVTASITKKIVTINKGIININYKVGE